MNRNPIRNSAILLIVVLIFMGCSNEDASDDAARLRIKLTDSASPVIKELHIDITAIELFVSDSTSEDGEWVSLDYAGGEYNLLRLMNGKTVQLVDQYFPADKKIEKIKLLIGDNNRMLTVTQQTIPLQKSPEIIDGIVIDNIDAELTPYVITSIIIDINAALSIRESNENYFLNPSARAFPEIYGGSIRGYVAPPEANPRVAIIQETDTFMTLPEADGMFLFIGLNEGPWEIHLMADPATNYRDTVFPDTISSGQKEELTPKPIQLPFGSN